MEPHVALDDAAFPVRGLAPAEYANISDELYVQNAAPEAPSVPELRAWSLATLAVIGLTVSRSRNPPVPIDHAPVSHRPPVSHK